MQYKSIILELLQQQPALHSRLRRSGALLTVMEACAKELKTRHEAWKEHLSEGQTDIDRGQIAKAAIEFALQEVESRLRTAFPADDQKPLSLDAAMAFIRNPTSRD